MGTGGFYPGNATEGDGVGVINEASMGPGCFYPGNATEGDGVGVINEASMGPGCFYPGNQRAYPGPISILKLQWGRDVSIPEMRRQLHHHDCFRRFNGAGMFLSRKCGGGRVVSGAGGASMGPGCFYPGNATG